MYVASRKACKELGLCANTLRKYADEGRIECVRNSAGQRLYNVQSFISNSSGRESIICYCRVSSNKQRDDLARQIIFMRERFPGAEVIEDIGSGLNFKRPGLRAILDRVLRGDKLTLIVAHRDRLCRFGFDLLQYLIERNSGKLLVLENVVYSPEQELTQDLLSILHVFSCRMHGLRKYSSEIKKDKALSNPKSEATLPAVVRSSETCLQSNS